MKTSLSRKKDHLQSLTRNLATSFILYEEIKTTRAKSRVVIPVIEKLINTAKKNDLNARRKLSSYLFDENAVKKLLEVIAPRYKKVNSGFINMFHVGPRLGDNAPIVILKLKSVQAKLTEEIKEKDAQDTKGGKANGEKAGRKIAAKA